MQHNQIRSIGLEIIDELDKIYDSFEYVSTPSGSKSTSTLTMHFKLIDVMNENGIRTVQFKRFGIDTFLLTDASRLITIVNELFVKLINLYSVIQENCSASNSRIFQMDQAVRDFKIKNLQYNRSVIENWYA